jgi:hypothetical protein
MIYSLPVRFLWTMIRVTYLARRLSPFFSSERNDLVATFRWKIVWKKRSSILYFKCQSLKIGRLTLMMIIIDPWSLCNNQLRRNSSSYFIFSFVCLHITYISSLLICDYHCICFCSLHNETKQKMMMIYIIMTQKQIQL